MKPLYHPILISYLLLILGILLPMIPLCPHHHHEDGCICMKHDLPLSEEAHHHQHHHHQTSCLEANCITTHLYRQDKVQSIEIKAPVTADIQPAALFSYLYSLLITPSRSLREYLVPRKEPLYVTASIPSHGLRAPPQF